MGTRRFAIPAAIFGLLCLAACDQSNIEERSVSRMVVLEHCAEAAKQRIEDSSRSLTGVFDAEYFPFLDREEIHPEVVGSVQLTSSEIGAQSLEAFARGFVADCRHTFRDRFEIGSTQDWESLRGLLSAIELGSTVLQDREGRRRQVNPDTVSLIYDDGAIEVYYRLEGE